MSYSTYCCRQSLLIRRRQRSKATHIGLKYFPNFKVFRLPHFWPQFYTVVLWIALFSILFIYFPYSIWTFISLFLLDFYFPFLYGLLFPFSIWTFMSLFYLNFHLYFLFSNHFQLFLIFFQFFFQSWSHFGFFKIWF